MPEEQFYYSIKGSEREGWTLMQYRYAKDKEGNTLDCVTNYWLKPKDFTKLSDLLAELVTIEDIQP